MRPYVARVSSLLHAVVDDRETVREESQQIIAEKSPCEKCTLIEPIKRCTELLRTKCSKA